MDDGPFERAEDKLPINVNFGPASCDGAAGRPKICDRVGAPKPVRTAERPIANFAIFFGFSSAMTVLAGEIP